jgi:hypothetical protein
MPRQRKPSGKAPGFGEARRLSTFRRKAGKRLSRRVLIIVSEGSRTEPMYFQALRQCHGLPTLRIVSGQGSPISVVKAAEQESGKLDDKRDEVWCVFDTEIKANNPSFDRAVDLAKSHGLNLAVSNPAFEYWYLLHFEYTDRPFHDADDVINKLKDHLPPYDESTPVFQELETRTGSALQNAERLRQGASEPWDEFPNPSTGVGQLVIQILELAKQPC